MQVAVQHDLDKLARTLARYAAATRRDVEEVLDKKGRDLGIKLYQGFSARQWGGEGKKPKGARRALAFADLRARTAAGLGTRVRPSLRREYVTLRNALRRGYRGLVGEAARLRNIRARVSLWQRTVGREIALRARGIGVLAASFLWFRRARRWSIAQQAYVRSGRSEFVRNKTGRPLGHVVRGPGFIRVVADLKDPRGRHPHAIVADRYGIVARAVREVERDTAAYLLERQRRLLVQAFAGASGKAGA